MSDKSIVDKIALRLKQGVVTEEACIYLLTQIRKYIEQENIKKYWNLRMCANWSLHSSLDSLRNKVVKDFMAEINDFLLQSEKKRSYEIDRQPGLKHKLMFLTALREELRTLLKSLDIDTSICDDPLKSQTFLRVFGNAIEGTPLIYRSDDDSYLFDEISFSRRKSIFSSDNWPQTLYWTIKKGNHVLLRISTNLTPIPVGNGYLYVESLVFMTNPSFE